MYRKHFFRTLSVLGISSVNFTDKLWYTKYIIREVVLKSVAAPPRERFGTLYPGYPCYWLPPRSSPSVIALSFSWRVGFLASLAVYVLVSWLDGRRIGSVFLLRRFDVRTHPLTTRERARFDGVGCPHSRGLSWPTVWSFSCSESFSRFLASVRIHVHVCWPSTERWWVPTAFGGVSGPFSFLDVRWCERMVGDGEGDEERGDV